MVTLWLVLSAQALGQDEPAPEEVGDTGVEQLPIIEGPAILEYVEAPYPDEAQELELEATVLLYVELDETGAVISVEVPEPVGHGFDEAAKAAVEQMSFSPARTEVGPVPVIFEFAYGFEFTPEPEPEPVEAPVNFEGRLRQMGTREPVEGARVTIVDTDLVALTDEQGRWQLRGVPLGEQAVKVFHPDHTSLDTTLTFTEGEVTEVELWLRSLSYRANESVGVYRREKQEVTRRTITVEEIKRIPGTFGDPVKVIQTLPGAARSPFGTGLPIIRGSSPQDSGVYVDGIRIPLIFHLTGTTSVINQDLVESVDYLPGGYGVQFGRALAGTIDIKTKKRFEENKLTWGTDVLDTQLFYGGTLDKDKKHGIAVGARRSYIDAFIPLFVNEDDLFTIRPVYADWQAKYTFQDLGPDEEASVFYYGFIDTLSVSTPDSTAQGSDQDTQGDLSTEYSTHRVMARYQRRVNDQLLASVTPSLGYDYTDFGLGNAFRLANWNTTLQLRSRLEWTPAPWIEVIPGTDFIFGYWKFEFSSPLQISALGDPLAEREDVYLSGDGTVYSPDAYVRVNLRPLADRDRWLIVAGLRAQSVIYQYGSWAEVSGQDAYAMFALDPRLATRLQLVEGLTLKASTGLYQQPPQPFQSLGTGTSTTLNYERSWQSTFGAELQLTQAISWDVEVYYRWLDNLVGINNSFDGFGSSAFQNQGFGRVYGLETILRHNPTNRLFGWVSYTLSRAERKDREDEDWYLFQYDQTHILTALAGYDLPWDFGISFQVQYVTGSPTTYYVNGTWEVDANDYDPAFSGGYRDERLPDFFQTSLRLDKLFTFKFWQLELYAEAINAVRGVNPEFTVYNYDYTDYAYVEGLPFIPNVGLEAKFRL